MRIMWWVFNTLISATYSSLCPNPIASYPIPPAAYFIETMIIQNNAKPALRASKKRTNVPAVKRRRKKPNNALILSHHPPNNPHHPLETNRTRHLPKTDHVRVVTRHHTTKAIKELGKRVCKTLQVIHHCWMKCRQTLFQVQ